MAMTITIELTDLDEKCMRYFCADPQEFISNLVESRVFAAKQEIYAAEVRRMTADPEITSIPASVDAVVESADIRLADANPELPDVSPPQ